MSISLAFRTFLSLLLVSGFGAAYLAGRQSPSALVTKTQPQGINLLHPKTFTSSVSALGTLEPQGDVHVLDGPMTQLGGAPRIRTINVSEGDRVVRNQILATFENSPQLFSENNRILANIKSKISEISILKIQNQRFENLTASGSFPVAELEEKKIRLAGYYSQLQELQGTLNTLNERLYGDTAIRSPISGVILEVNARVGERARESGVMEVGNTSRMQASVEVDEADIGSIKIGQPVRINSENGAFPSTFKGVVSSIGLKASAKLKVGQDPGLAPDSEVRVIKVVIELDASSSRNARTLTGVKVIAVIKIS